MTILKFIKAIAGGAVFVAAVLGLCYCSELPKYNFQRESAKFAQMSPGTRLVDRSYAVDLTQVDLVSFATWIWEPATTWNYAFPDPVVADRFYMVDLIYGKTRPDFSLIDVDCKAHEEKAEYDLDEPETAVAARDPFGDPVKGSNGKIYRLSKYWQRYPIPQKWIHAFCDTNWKVEREAVANAMFGQRGTWNR